MKIVKRFFLIVVIYSTIIAVIHAHGAHSPKVKPKIEPTFLYKIFTSDEWRKIDNKAFDFTMGSDLDLKNQYLHLSTAKQVKHVADKFYPNLKDGFLIKIDYTKIKDEITWQRKANGTIFPHMYETVPVEAIVEAYPFDTSTFQFPTLEF